MSKIPIITNHAFENMVGNLEHLSLDEVVEFRNLESSLQMALVEGSHGFLSLPHLPTRTTN
jgi:hypothetical protein